MIEAGRRHHFRAPAARRWPRRDGRPPVRRVVVEPGKYPCRSTCAQTTVCSRCGGTALSWLGLGPDAAPRRVAVVSGLPDPWFLTGAGVPR